MTILILILFYFILFYPRDYITEKKNFNFLVSVSENIADITRTWLYAKLLLYFMFKSRCAVVCVRCKSYHVLLLGTFFTVSTNIFFLHKTVFNIYIYIDCKNVI